MLRTPRPVWPGGSKCIGVCACIQKQQIIPWSDLNPAPRRPRPTPGTQRRRHWNSRKRRKNFAILRHVGSHQRQYFMKIWKFLTLQPALIYLQLCPAIILRHRDPTVTTITYLSTVWRADIANDCQNSEQERKPQRKYTKMRFAFDASPIRVLFKRSPPKPSLQFKWPKCRPRVHETETLKKNRCRQCWGSIFWRACARWAVQP